MKSNTQKTSIHLMDDMNNNNRLIDKSELDVVSGGGDCKCLDNHKIVNTGLSSITKELNQVMSVLECKSICCEVLGYEAYAWGDPTRLARDCKEGKFYKV